MEGRCGVTCDSSRAVRWEGGSREGFLHSQLWSSGRSPQVRLCSCSGEGTIPISLLASITSHSCCFSRLVTRSLDGSVLTNGTKSSTERTPGALEELPSLSVARSLVSPFPFGVLGAAKLWECAGDGALGDDTNGTEVGWAGLGCVQHSCSIPCSIPCSNAMFAASARIFILACKASRLIQTPQEVRTW